MLKTIEVRRSACGYLEEEEIVIGFNTHFKTVGKLEKEEILGA